MPAQNGQNLQEDIELFESQLKQEPNSPDINYNIAQAYFLMNKIDLAVKFLEKTVFLAPDDCEAIARLASIYWKIGKLANARDLFSRAVKMSPEDSGLWYGMGMVLADLAAGQEALRAFEKALQYCHDEEQKKLIIYYTGLIHLTNRDYPAFAKSLQQLKNAPEHYKELEKLGKLWRK